MTQRPIVSVDHFPDIFAMPDSMLESLCDQAFTQLEVGPVVEGLLGYYLSLQAELEDRQSRIMDQAPLPARQEDAPQPVSA